MIDINNPEHEAALRWACEKWDNLGYERDALRRQMYGGLDLSGEQCTAIRAISSTVPAAELIRRLVERGGMQKHIVSTPIGIALYPLNPLPREEEEFWFAAHELPGLIARLLATAPGSGPAEVSKALKGAT